MGPELPLARLHNLGPDMFGGIPHGGFWVTADARFCITRLRPRGHWKLSAYYCSPSAAADDAFLLDHALHAEQAIFDTRREALEALALAQRFPRVTDGLR